MDDTKKMLRAIINGQSSLRAEMIGRFEKVDGRFEKLERTMKSGFKKTNDRIDKVRKAVAYLEDDIPSREEFEELERKITPHMAV